MNQRKRKDTITVSYGVFPILTLCAYVMGAFKVCVDADGTLEMGMIHTVVPFAIIAYLVAKIVLLYQLLMTMETWYINTWQIMCWIEITIASIGSSTSWFYDYHYL